jgi:ABC-type sugar transport system substrate-binding protein
MIRSMRTLLVAAVSTGIVAGAAFADTSDKKIAFSNNYAGNSWRQAMLKSYDIVTKKAVADGRRRRVHHRRQGGSDPSRPDPESHSARL